MNFQILFTFYFFPTTGTRGIHDITVSWISILLQALGGISSLFYTINRDFLHLQVNGLQKNVDDRSEYVLVLQRALSKMTSETTVFGDILAHETYRGVILPSIPIFSGSRNPIEQLVRTLTRFGGSHRQFWNGRQENNIFIYNSIAKLESIPTAAVA